MIALGALLVPLLMGLKVHSFAEALLRFWDSLLVLASNPSSPDALGDFFYSFELFVLRLMILLGLLVGIAKAAIGERQRDRNQHP